MFLAFDFFWAVHNNLLDQLVDRNCIQFLQVRILLCSRQCTLLLRKLSLSAGLVLQQHFMNEVIPEQLHVGQRALNTFQRSLVKCHFADVMDIAGAGITLIVGQNGFETPYRSGWHRNTALTHNPHNRRALRKYWSCRAWATVACWNEALVPVPIAPALQNFDYGIPIPMIWFIRQ